MKVALGTDEAAQLPEAIAAYLAQRGHEVVSVAEGAEWPEVGRAVATEVSDGRVDVGICCCWTGTGVSIAANKVPGARAALCGDPETARGARRWNDANVLALGIRQTSGPVGIEIVEAFLSGEVDPGEGGAIGRVEP